ncbi:NAD-dependent epimerase/dehydratase family protein [Aurantimicrobium minutum]|uniref:NAD-dependent epimerase/dehydratase family protein n=1 Tax=Aurantimicrobium minutum TaxID=708131 RepID=UPI0024746800|nr:NAD-dependent epimerase/dehydratase family protein [Aurantimicrobium minutum]MDH6537268.1 nucleoside-diphosphate-sugar epimerase [Aurantimicrobium minutum]
MISLNNEHKLVITGAGGWLGTELLEKLLEEHGPEKIINNVVCLGSHSRTKTLSDGTEIPVQLFTDSIEIQDVAGFVHLAFLTRDKVATYGTEDYSFRNLAITSRAIELIEQIRPRWIATVSSGAVFSKPGGPLENILTANPYGFTKRVEETMLTQVAQEIGANISIGRLWGAMGSFMPVNRAYAVSDFIVQAHSAQQISIRANHEVWRRYCDAGEFMEVLITAAENLKKTSFDSGGELIELGNLATTISSLMDANTLVSRPNSSGNADRYFPEATQYESLCNELQIHQKKLVDIIRSTLSGHLAQLTR